MDCVRAGNAGACDETHEWPHKIEVMITIKFQIFDLFIKCVTLPGGCGVLGFGLSFPGRRILGTETLSGMQLMSDLTRSRCVFFFRVLLRPSFSLLTSSSPASSVSSPLLLLLLLHCFVLFFFFFFVALKPGIECATSTHAKGS